jgi:hypothetical protein
MGIRLPGELEWLLNEMNYFWPEVDEDKLFELGQHWISYGGKLQGISGEAQSAAEEVWSNNHGPTVEAFKARWEHEQSPAAVLKDGATAAYALGAALFICAIVVLALKINVIIQLVTLFIDIIEAIALGPETLGASVLQIPVVKEIIGRVIGLIINMAVDALLG